MSIFLTKFFFSHKKADILCFINCKFYYNCFITLQGFPTATTFDGISLFTTLPAPITVLSPIVTPGSTITFPPIHTLFPTFIGFAYSNPLFLLSASSGCPAV